MKKLFCAIAIIAFIMSAMVIIPGIRTLNTLSLFDTVELAGKVKSVERKDIRFSESAGAQVGFYYILSLDDLDKSIRVKNGPYLASNFEFQIRSETIKITCKDMGSYYLALHLELGPETLMNYDEYDEYNRKWAHIDLATATMPLVFGLFMLIAARVWPNQSPKTVQ